MDKDDIPLVIFGYRCNKLFLVLLNGYTIDLLDLRVYFRSRIRVSEPQASQRLLPLTEGLENSSSSRIVTKTRPNGDR